MEGLCDPGSLPKPWDSACFPSLGTNIKSATSWKAAPGFVPELADPRRVEPVDCDVSVANPNIRRTDGALRKRHQEFMGVTGRRRAASQRSALRCRREPSIIFRSRTCAVRPAPSGRFCGSSGGTSALTVISARRRKKNWCEAVVFEPQLHSFSRGRSSKSCPRPRCC
jgi:hypothetical protein